MIHQKHTQDIELRILIILIIEEILPSPKQFFKFWIIIAFGNSDHQAGWNGYDDRPGR
jgi:hypothetical protein